MDACQTANSQGAHARNCPKIVSNTLLRCADPLYNDETFALSVVFLEELGATGNKGLTSLLSNPVIADGVAGLATSATAGNRMF